MRKVFDFSKFIMLLGMLVFSMSAYSDDHVDVIQESSKPSVSNALRGAKGYTMSLISNGVNLAASNANTWPFIDVYFHKEVAKWIAETCPDVTPGVKYNYPGCAHVHITVKYNYTGEQTYRAGAGWMAPDGYWYTVGAYVVELNFGNKFYYQYKISPSFKIKDGSFNDHTVFYKLKQNICQEVCRYNPSATPHYARLMTQWRETSLKQYFDEQGDEIEGIYESTVPNTDGHTNKYKLALKKNYDKSLNYDYFLIYLGGGNYFRNFEEGEIKAFMYPTSTAGLYKVDWLMGNKEVNSNFYITIDNGGFLCTSPETNQELYLKLYPTSQSRKPQQPEMWQGSGFALNDGYVVTNYHVADGAKSILVYQDKGDGTRQSYKAILAASDKVNDIAILKIDDPKFKGFGAVPYKIKTGSCEVGESVWALGYPMADIMGDEVKFTDGKISARSGIDGEKGVYQISVPIQHGNSGGPLFDTKGNIVGITSSGLNRQMLQTENVNYAIKSSYLRLLIEDALPTSIIPQGTALQGQSLTTQIKLAKKFVFYIECSSSDDGRPASQAKQASPSAPSTPSTPSQPEPTKPSMTPLQAMSILQGQSGADKKSAFDALLWWGENNDAEACGYLGTCYEFGVYVSKDLARAIEWFHKGADGEDARSLHELGVFYYEGEGVAKDIQKAKGYFLRAAKKKCIASYSALGELFLAENDATNAIKYLEEGAAAHSESAYYLLLRYYYHDKRDPHTAYTYLEMEMYDRENGVIVDAYGENGYRFEYYMGCYYEYGLPPMQKNIKKAKEWYQKAANHGDRDSKEKLEKLKNVADERQYNLPKHRVSEKADLTLMGVSVKENSTELSFAYFNSKYEFNGWISISKGTYIEDAVTHTKYKLVDTKGITISPKKTTAPYMKVTEFKLIFEKIPDSCTLINCLEPGNSVWKVYDIELR